MKKLIAIVSSLFLVAITSAKAELGMGVTIAGHMIDGSGKETTRQSGQVNNGSHDEKIVVPELFIEAIGDNGARLGVSYIPTRDVGSKSRSDTNSEGDTGTYKADAELDDVVQIYVDMPMAQVAGYQTHLKLGVQHVTVSTLESLNSGSTYPNQDVLGYTLGLGIRGDLPYDERMFYKADLTYTDFEDYSADSNSSPANRVEAELEDIALKFSVGYRF